MENTELLSVEEAARRLGRCTTWIRKECEAGRIPGALKVGKVRLIPAEGLAAYQPRPRGWKKGTPRGRKEQQPE